MTNDLPFCWHIHNPCKVLAQAQLQSPQPAKKPGFTGEAKPYDGSVRCHSCRELFYTAKAYLDHLPCPAGRGVDKGVAHGL